MLAAAPPVPGTAAERPGAASARVRRRSLRPPRPRARRRPMDPAPAAPSPAPSAAPVAAPTANCPWSCFYLGAAPHCWRHPPPHPMRWAISPTPGHSAPSPAPSALATPPPPSSNYPSPLPPLLCPLPPPARHTALGPAPVTPHPPADAPVVTHLSHRRAAPNPTPTAAQAPPPTMRRSPLSSHRRSYPHRLRLLRPPPSPPPMSLAPPHSLGTALTPKPHVRLQSCTNPLPPSLPPGAPEEPPLRRPAPPRAGQSHAPSAALGEVRGALPISLQRAFRTPSQVPQPPMTPLLSGW
mmetsp:Transcript_77730/g.166658  ORF Transcript_77730/g.166658 Transcript_77730/m.166658 type:complete len:296 (-) Transcript_77730:56-943(-)